MKKRTMIALIVAVALILAGGTILMLGFSLAQNAAPQTSLTEQEVLITESFHDVVINTDCDVHFMPYNGDVDAQVIITGEPEQIYHEIMVEEGVLKIKMIDHRDWTDHIQISNVLGTTEKMEMTVYLPNTQYETLRITTNTGDIKFPGVLAAKEALLRSDTGDVWLEGGPVEMLDCMLSTGDITVRGGEGMFMKLRTGTGKLDIRDVTAQELHLGIDTGDTEVVNVIAPTFTINGGTGDVDLENVQAETYLQVFTDTGDISAENCKATNVNVATSTGDLDVPAEWQFQRIETGSGNIKYE